MRPLSFLLKPHGAPRRRAVDKIRYLREQDGVPERIFKAKLTRQFALTSEVERAYLLRAELDGRMPAIVLALRGDSAQEERIATLLSTVFMGLFQADQKLQTRFINGDEEAQIVGLCRPFFDRPAGVQSL